MGLSLIFYMVNLSLLDPCLLWAIDPDEECHKGNCFGIFKIIIMISVFLWFCFEITYFIWCENHPGATVLL